MPLDGFVHATCPQRAVSKLLVQSKLERGLIILFFPLDGQSSQGIYKTVLPAVVKPEARSYCFSQLIKWVQVSSPSCIF